MIFLINKEKEKAIKEVFNRFCHHYPFFPLESAIEYFSILGGMEEMVTLDYFEDIASMVTVNFVENFTLFKQQMQPSYLLEPPYCKLLSAVARGDGRMHSALRKAHLSEEVGEYIIKELVALGILRVEPSREKPLKTHPKHKLKKSLRHYRIQDKLRFISPFMRFWFGFIFQYQNDLIRGESRVFLQNFHNHHERLYTLVYEQLCDVFLVNYFTQISPLVTHGSYWNQHSEFDILGMTSDSRLVLGECKYKDRKVCKNELNKLRAKAEKSRIKVDIYVLFSKDGFSNELLGMEDERLLLFDLNDIQGLCH